MAELPNPEQLRAVLAVMRECGAVRLETGDVRIVLGAAPATLRPGSKRDPDLDDEDDDAAEEQSEEDQARAAWNTHWSRMLRSSGAPIPPFPGLEKARGLGVVQ